MPLRARLPSPCASAWSPSLASPSRRRGQEEESGEKSAGGQPGVQRFLRAGQRGLAQGEHVVAGSGHAVGAGPARAARATAADRPAQQRHAGHAGAAWPKLLGDFWASGLDEAAVERDGANPIAPLLSRIDAIRRSKDVPAAIAALHQVGIPVAFNFSADVDLQDLDRHIGYFSQGGLGLPDPALLHPHRCRHACAARPLHRLRVEDPRPDRQQAGAAQGRHAGGARSRKRASRRRRGRWSHWAIRARTTPRSRRATLGKQYRHLQLDDFLKAQGVSDDSVSLANPQLFAQLDALVDGLKPAAMENLPALPGRRGDGAVPVEGMARCRFRLPRPGAAWRDRAALAPAAGAGCDQPRRRPDGRSRIRRPLPARSDEVARDRDRHAGARRAGPRHRPQHLDESRGKDRSQGQARQAQDRNRRADARPRLQRAADGPRQFRRQHADRIDLAPSRGDAPDRPRQRRPPLGRAAAATGAGLRHRAEPPDRHRGDAAGAGAGHGAGCRRAIRRVRRAGRPRTHAWLRRQRPHGRCERRPCATGGRRPTRRRGNAHRATGRAIQRLRMAGADRHQGQRRPTPRRERRRPRRRRTRAGMR